MNTKHAFKETPRVSHGRKIIGATVTSCLLISATILVQSWFRPSSVRSSISSSSTAHGDSSRRSPGRVPAYAMPLNRVSRAEARQILKRAGYQDVRGLREDGAYFRATASRAGNGWEVEVDRSTRLIARAPYGSR